MDASASRDDDVPVEDGSDLLAAAAEARELAASLQRQVDAAEQRADESRAAANAAAARLRREAADVDRLESVGWTRALATLRGRRDEDLRREQAEAADARLALDHAQRRHDRDVQSVGSLQSRLRELGDVDAAYDEAGDVREAWLREHGGEVGQALADLAEEDGELLAEETELREAQEAGGEAHRLLTQALRSLGSAESWATWDTFGGGGLFTDAVKYDRLRTVGRELEAATEALRELDRELSDVELPAVGERLHVDGWEHAFDVWFDNFFSDWVVRRRITDARAATVEVLHRVEHVGRELGAARGRVAERRTEVADERDGLLA